jgi:hypothetical protein
MKFLHLSFVLVALSSSYGGAAASSVSLSSATECPVKAEVCEQRVKVEVTGVVDGLMTDVPQAVYDAFVAASAACLQCVDESNAHAMSSGHHGCNYNKCKGCGEQYETWKNCRSCCGECRCMGCSWNYGSGGNRECDRCCSNPGVVPDTQRRALGGEEGGGEGETDVLFSLDVCMDDISPLDGASSHYVDYEALLADFETELQQCYGRHDEFLGAWSSLCAEAGVDLDTLARRGDGGSSAPVLFGLAGVDAEGAVVTTYSSDQDHQASSHAIFYSALGFVALSAFAVVGAAVVVKVINARKALEEERAAQWVSEMALGSDTATTNPLEEAAAAASPH